MLLLLSQLVSCCRCGKRSGALEELYDAALEKTESFEPPSFGETLEGETSHMAKFDDTPPAAEAEERQSSLTEDI